MTIELAPELIDLIIDHVATNSWFALKACSLVCRFWLPRSRYRLFEKRTRLVRARTSPPFEILYAPYCTFLPHFVTVEVSIHEIDHISAADMRCLTHVSSLKVYVQSVPRTIPTSDWLSQTPQVLELRVTSPESFCLLSISYPASRLCENCTSAGTLVS
jgi:hypothetical protein